MIQAQGILSLLVSFAIKCSVKKINVSSEELRSIIGRNWTDAFSNLLLMRVVCCINPDQFGRGLFFEVNSHAACHKRSKFISVARNVGTARSLVGLNFSFLNPLTLDPKIPKFQQHWHKEMLDGLRCMK